MNREVLEIALAGFLHNIGMFIRGMVEDTNSKLLDGFDKAKYQNDNNISTEKVYTEYFIKNILKEIPEITDIEKFIDLAITYNISSNEKNIINVADRISSGITKDDGSELIQYNEWIKIKLMSIFDELDDKIKDYSSRRYQYPISKFDEISIFPEPKTDKSFGYSAILDGFCNDLKNIQKTNLKDWFMEFDDINKKWTTFIPSSIKGMSDISLYDYARTTSAIAQSLYVYHKDKNDFNNIENNNIEKKLLFFKAKFNGIQNFIFATGGETNKNAAKILRGRSFYISLLMKKVCSLLCDELGLAHTAIIMNAAGSITAILPNTQNIKDKLQILKEKINNWLIKQFYGETSISFAYIEIAADDLKNKLQSIGSLIADELDIEKYHKIPINNIGIVKEYFKENEVLCKYCGKKPATKKENQENIKCSICEDLTKIGENLIKKKQFDLSVPLFDTYKTVYPKDYDNLYVPKNSEGITKNFDEIIGNDIKGINVLGVLKADIDNLGSLFYKVSKDSGISKQVTFSRMLDAFWTMWLPKKLEKDFIDIYTVFSGGDDLFLIGKWDDIINFSFELKKEFTRYTCNSSQISFSAGIALLKPGFPITDFYYLSENSLEKSKHYNSKNFKFTSKNALTVFDTTISWEQIESCKNLDKYFDENTFNTAFKYKILSFIEMAEKVDNMKEDQENITIKDMQSLKWQSLLSYFISRNNSVSSSINKKDLINSFISKISNKNDRNVLKIVLYKNIYKNRDRR